MIANDGSAFAGSLSVPQDEPILDYIRNLEDRCSAWQDGKRREIERAAENAVAFEEVGELVKVPADEVKETASAMSSSAVTSPFVP